jgi:hypothetical protein
VIRWEVWNLKKVGARWKIRSRVFLDRQLIRSGQSFPSCEYRREPAWWRFEVKGGKNLLAVPAQVGRRRAAGHVHAGPLAKGR